MPPVELLRARPLDPQENAALRQSLLPFSDRMEADYVALEAKVAALGESSEAARQEGRSQVSQFRTSLGSSREYYEAALLKQGIPKTSAHPAVQRLLEQIEAYDRAAVALDAFLSAGGESLLIPARTHHSAARAKRVELEALLQ
jgi:hypothetical protein